MRLFVDNITNVDFSYLCPERGLLGETWLAHVELEGPLDEQGMVCDFGIVKKQLRQWLDNTLDHKLLVPSTNALVQIKTHPGTTEVTLSPLIEITSPDLSIALLSVDTINPESVARWCEHELKDMFTGVDTLHFTFTPEVINGPFYHYSHGLKKHLGNCQRIAHGHRSKITIWKNDVLCEQSMARWAQAWQDIYLATDADCIGQTADTTSFKYNAQQGEFTLTLPTKQCYFMATDTTVEHIAQHIADTLAEQQPGNRFKVKAYEGIGKGAIAERFVDA